MLFSEYFNITRGQTDDWFDPILIQDTNLFIDPLLLGRAGRTIPALATARTKLTQFYDFIFREAAQTSRAVGSQRLIRLHAALAFPEVKELCLGYTAESTDGAGTAREMAPVWLAGVFDSIDAGLERLEHFEEVALFRQGIGADRISDMVANLLRTDLAAYTADICARHGVETRTFTHRRAYFDLDLKRWEEAEVSLPFAEVDGRERPIMLVPEEVLRPLPSIHWTAFRDYVVRTENAVLRAEFGIQVREDLNRAAIVEIARAYADTRVRDFVRGTTRRPGAPYDFRRDSGRRHAWYAKSNAYARRHPIGGSTPRSLDELAATVDGIIGQFRHFVEQAGGWDLFWVEPGRARNEKSAQLVFLGLAGTHARLLGIDVTREPDTGRGPVDFKFSVGHDLRMHVELKLASNSALEHGVTEQTPTYALADQVSVTRVVVVAHKEADLARVERDLPTWCERVRAAHGIDQQGTVISVLKPPSASHRGRRVGRVPLGDWER